MPTAMIPLFNPILARLMAGVLVLLVIGTIVGAILATRATSEGAKATVANLNARIRAWWVMVAVFAVAVATGGLGSVILFAAMSFLALREFMTLTPTSRADHGVLFWSFFIFAPIQYVLVWMQWYGLFAILIPVYAFVTIRGGWRWRGTRRGSWSARRRCSGGSWRACTA
jgi:phosphatidate cytidylyltransferase